MKTRVLITGIAALFLTTGTAHADEKWQPRENWLASKSLKNFARYCANATARDATANFNATRAAFVSNPR